MQKLKLEVNNKYDYEFINLILEIEKRQENLSKGQKIKIQSWIKKFCIPTENLEWKKNRNLHAILLLDMILINRFEQPYDKFPKEDEALPLLSKYNVKSVLSDKFYKISFEKNFENNLEGISEGKKNLEIISSPSKSKLFENKILLKQSNNNDLIN
jgi:hypothetical protein